MKNVFQKNSLGLGVVFVFLIWVFTGCRQVSSECSSCKVLPPDSRNEISISNKSYNVKIWNAHSNYQFAFVETNQELLANSLSLVEDNLGKDEELATTVFYLSGLVKNDIAARKEDVLGYGVYFLKENKLRYRFYLKSDDRFQIIPELNCEVKAMSTNDIYNVSNLYFGSRDVCALTITCREILLKPNVSKSHTLGYNIDYLYRKMTPKINGRITATPGAPLCERPCTGTDPGCIYSFTGLNCTYFMSGDDNDEVQAKSLIGDRGVSQDVVDDAYNVTLHYSFRDSFLLKHQLTKKYVDYYYGMTPEAYLTSDILSRMPDYLQKVNTKVVRILTNQTEEILIDEQFKEETLSILKLYKSAAPSDKERAYFLDVERDVNIYAGKKIGEIVRLLD